MNENQVIALLTTLDELLTSIDARLSAVEGRLDSLEMKVNALTSIKTSSAGGNAGAVFTAQISVKEAAKISPLYDMPHPLEWADIAVD